ncbi:hypothetical protein B9Z35_12770 [Limnohabitans sp. Jir61]|nr:hypothetical protein B9Z35_12770 [Limnohabitans sp. Jir61]
MIYVTATAKFQTTNNCNFENENPHQFRLKLDDYVTKEGLLNLYCAILHSLPSDTQSFKSCHYSIPSSSHIFNKYKFHFELYNFEEDSVIDECRLEVKTNVESNFKNAHQWKIEIRLLSNIHGEVNHDYPIDRDLNAPYNWDAFIQSLKQRCCLLFVNTNWIV